MTTTPTHYSRLQIGLHWLVVLCVAFQIGFHDYIVAATELSTKGETPDALTSLMSLAHVSSGLLAGLATALRLVLRLTRGVPGHAAGTRPWQALVSNVVHWGFYVLLFAMVITGMLTYLGLAPLGEVHFIIDGFLVLTILLHVGGALFNQFVLRNGTLMRMLRTGP